jgi:flagellar hook-basal body protein
MLYGLYLSATGVMTNSYRQDVIANNLANAQTVGFKKDLTLFKERPTASEESPAHADWTDPLMDKMGGGTFAMPISVDTTQGELQHTGSNLDTAIDGDGYFAVDANGKQRLTRNGEFLIDRDGNLVLADGRGEKVLDPSGKPIQLDSSAANVTDRPGRPDHAGRQSHQQNRHVLRSRSDFPEKRGRHAAVGAGYLAAFAVQQHASQ